MPTPEEEGAADAHPPAVAPLATAPVPAVGLHGVVTAFEPAQESWSEYVERLEHYFVANDIVTVEKQRAILLHAVGPATYRLIRTLVSPKKVVECTFQELVEKAQEHFNPKPSPIVKRYEFNTRTQGESESIATFVAELRKIAEYCEYGPVLSDMLRDRLVCGTCNKTIQRKLLQESALSTEAAEKDSKRLTSGGGESVIPLHVDRVNDRPPPTAPSVRGSRYSVAKKTKKSQQSDERKTSDNPKSCYRCGGSHNSTVCPYLKYTCNYCKKQGHLARVCHQRARSSPGDTNFVEVEEYPLFHITSDRVKPLYVTVSVNGNLLSMEIDTGAAVSSQFGNIRDYSKWRDQVGTRQVGRTTQNLHGTTH